MFRSKPQSKPIVWAIYYMYLQDLNTQRVKKKAIYYDKQQHANWGVKRYRLFVFHNTDKCSVQKKWK